MTSDRPTLSVVAPVFNEEAILHELYRRLSQVLDGAGLSWELVLVNDGSRDRSPQIMRELHDQDPRVKVVDFARNFGHQIAITAGRRLRPGRRRRDHRRRPAGPAGSHPRPACQVARGLRGGLRRARRAQGRDLVQGVHRQGVLPDHLPDHRHQHPDGHRRFPADGSQGGGRAQDRCARSTASCAGCRCGWAFARPASSTCAPSATRARRSIR